MKKICWITPESFLDVDIPIIRGLTTDYEIIWYVYLHMNDQRRMFSEDDIVKFAQGCNIKYIIIYQKARLRNPINIYYYLLQILKFKKNNIDLIYTSFLGQPYFMIILYLFFKRNKVVVAFHDIKLHHNETFSFIKLFYHKIIWRLFKNFHFFSETQCKIFESYYRNKNILIAKLACKDFGKPKHPVKEPDEKIRFLFFGTIYFYKGLDILLNAINIIYEEFKIKKFELKITGKCTEWDVYNALIKYNDVINTDIRLIKNEEIPDLFYNADYLILPYRDVTQSGPLLIAYNYGIPVIASDHDGFRESIIDGKNGYLFKNLDSYDLALTLKKVIANKNKNLEIKNNLKQFVSENLSVNAIIHEYNIFFQKLLVK
jgi:glycosyltransferase involved in cell wall biosynthesis